MAGKKRASGGKLSRSEIVSVRLDPKLHYAAEIAAFRQRRTLSSLLECALDAFVAQVSAGPDGLTVEKVVLETWSADASERFVELAFRYPHLLSHNQQLLWDVICSYGPLWQGHWSKRFWTYRCGRSSLLQPRLQELWPKLEAVAAGQMSLSELPQIGVDEFIQYHGFIRWRAPASEGREHMFEVTWITPEEIEKIIEAENSEYSQELDSDKGEEEDAEPMVRRRNRRKRSERN